MNASTVVTVGSQIAQDGQNWPEKLFKCPAADERIYLRYPAEATLHLL